MEHYSIQAIEIFISEIVSDNGWHRGDVVRYKVNNCAWESEVALQPKVDQYGSYALQGRQIFQRGDQEKMLKDQAVTLMALQAYIYEHKKMQGVRWEETHPTSEL